MDNRNEFLFGIPQEAFGRLNKAYDDYRSIIEKEGRFLDRQDFLRSLVHRHKDLDFEAYENVSAGNIHILKRRKMLLPYDYGNDEFTFSTPFVDERKQMLGNIYLKVTALENRYHWSSDYEQPSILSTLLLLTSLLFLWFLLPSWVYLDARGRGMTSPLRWSLLTLVSLIFGLTIYLILRPDEAGAIPCPQCGHAVKGSRFCPFCGMVLASELCSRCGYPLSPSWTFCPNCQAVNTKEIPSGTFTESSSDQPPNSAPEPAPLPTSEP